MTNYDQKKKNSEGQMRPDRNHQKAKALAIVHNGGQPTPKRATSNRKNNWEKGRVPQQTGVAETTAKRQYRLTKTARS